MNIQIDEHRRLGHINLAVIGFLLMGTASGAETYHPGTTGAQVVTDMLADPDVPVNYLKRERMMGYLDGIIDATVGVAWCPARKSVPHEMNYVITEELSKSSTSALKGNAAPLVAAALGKMYPCAAGSTS